VNSTLPSPWLHPDTKARVSILPPGSDVTVRAGEAVRAGDVIANLPPEQCVIALADRLLLSRDAGIAAIEALDGMSVEAGESLGRHRTGLRTRTVQAPSSGIIRGMPEQGAICIIPRDERPLLRADRPGIVTDIEADRVTITSRVLCCHLAFVIGSSSAYGKLAITANGRNGTAPERPETVERASIFTALPHIAGIADLPAALRDAPGPIIVGTVSEAVAWEILTRSSAESDDAGQAVAVLLGPGERAVGERAIERLQIFDGSLLDLDLSRGEMTIFPGNLAEREWEARAQDSVGGEAFTVDPARWHMPCMVTGPAVLGSLETGVRTALVRSEPTSGGAEWVPVVNIIKCPD
jgi:hypothetical protein